MESVGVDREEQWRPWADLEGDGDLTWIPESLARWLAHPEPVTWTLSSNDASRPSSCEVSPGQLTEPLLKAWLLKFARRWPGVSPVQVRIKQGSKDLTRILVLVPEAEDAPSTWERLAELAVSDPQRVGRALRTIAEEASPGVKTALGVGMGELLDVFAESAAMKVVDKLQEEAGE